MAPPQLFRYRPHFAPSAVSRRLAVPSRSSYRFRNHAMALQPIDSNEHSIRFKVLEEVQLLAVVEHILARAAEDAAAAAASELPAGRARALELLQIGAVYVGVPQKGLGHITWLRSLELSTAATAATVPAGHFVRVHPRPKRYPACYQTDWPSRVLHCDSEYLVINKPPGLPCMRHESNAAEELAACVGRALGMPELEVCHRLDQWTTGVVVLSRTKEANKAFKRSLQDREAGLVKTYKALTYTAVPLGPQEHHMYDGPFNEGAPVLGGGNLRPRGPRLLSRTAHERWRVCRLDVRECREHSGALAWYQQYFDGGLQDTAYDIAVHRGSGPSGPNQHSTDPAPPPPPPPSPPQQLQPQQPPTGDRAQLSGSATRLRGAAAGPTWEPTPEEPSAPPAACPHPLQPSPAPHGRPSPPSDPSHSSPPPPPPPPAAEAAAVGAGRLTLYESTVDLHTGRTHQIRAQLAALGCPLVGDVMYAPIAGYLVGESGVVECSELVARVEALPMLERHVGLHAWRLSWRGMSFTAPPEWGDE